MHEDAFSSQFTHMRERERERKRERNLHSSHWFYPQTKEMNFPTFYKVMNFFYFVLYSYFTFSLSSMIWDQEKITFELFWCFMLHLIFKIGLDCSLPKRKKEKKLQSSIVLVEDFNELLSNVEKMSVSPFYILNIKILLEWFSSLGF